MSPNAKSQYDASIALHASLPTTAMEPIGVLLCNHHPIIRGGLRLLLERESQVRVVGEAANGPEAVMLAEYRHPDVVLLDVKLPHINGITAARRICSKDRKVGIVFVTVHADEEYVAEAFKAGARGYVLADSAQSDLIRSIRVVQRGDRFLSPGITSQLLREYERRRGTIEEQFSEHDKQLFCLLAAGHNDQEIARHFNTTVESARSDCHHLRSTLLRVDMPELIRRSVGALVSQ